MNESRTACQAPPPPYLLPPPLDTGHEWSEDAVRDGWYIDVEPFTSFTVGAHKTYQVNNLVSRTAHAYPDLWVAPGSAAATGYADDFVTGIFPGGGGRAGMAGPA